ncbi:uncharacterized protein PAC_04098 [Phialocephala subalpina]|uniref:Uncharacterized protein n=1 Tax=Phialocephala subalpina TaxID=576137 RepID=A0A1L7WN63_9HELO|nr:uncharacterized protein PAC_04098 [Phialocephala subalpina]
MPDPLTIAHGSARLILKFTSTVKTIGFLAHNLGSFEFSLTLRAIAADCEAIQTAWVAIETWTRTLPPAHDLEEQLVERLEQSTLFGTLVLNALDEDLDSLLRSINKLPAAGISNPAFRRRSAQMWDEVRFAKHQDRIRGQVATMTLLLQVINLQAATERTRLPADEKKTDETIDQGLPQENASQSSNPQKYSHHLGENYWDEAPQLQLQDPCSDLQFNDSKRHFEWYESKDTLLAMSIHQHPPTEISPLDYRSSTRFLHPVDIGADLMRE